MAKPTPGTKIVQKSSGYHEYEVIPDDESEHSVGDDRFVVKSIAPDGSPEIGTFSLEVLDQDNFYVSEK